MRWFSSAWDALSRDALYGLLRLRAEVFVVEQTCPYQDLDGRDEAAVHLWAEDANGAVASARVLPGPVIGRVVTRADVRGTGLGFALMERALAACPAGSESVHLSAQAHLEGFYRTFGFAVDGPGYLEDGIPHVPMGASGSRRTRGIARLQVAEARFEREVPKAVGGEGWGPDETRDHLERVSAVFRNQIASLIPTWSGAERATGEDLEREFALLDALRSARRFEAPAAVHPHGGVAGPMQTWATWQAALESLPEAADDRLLLQHPRAGLLTVPGALNFLAAHCDHHRKALLRRAVPCAP